MRVGVAALVAVLSFAACEPESPAPEAVPTPTAAEASPTPTEPAVTSCRGLEVPFDREVNTNLDKESGTLEFAYRKAGRNQQVTIRYRDDPWCRRNRDTRSLIFHVGGGQDILGCLSLPTEPPGGMTRVELWFGGTFEGRYQFSRSLVVHRDIPTVEGIASAAIEALIAGPNKAERRLGARAIGSPDTDLLGINVVGGTAHVDVDWDFHDTGLGTCCEGLVLSNLVGTVTQFEPIERMFLWTDGKRLKAWGGHAGILDPEGEKRPGPKWYRIAPAC